jgi:hypothetical protein
MFRISTSKNFYLRRENLHVETRNNALKSERDDTNPSKTPKARKYKSLMVEFINPFED